MFAAAWSYHRTLFFSFALFLVSGVLSVVMNEMLFMLIPFAWILIPIFFNYAITRTEQLFWLLLIMLPLSTELNITPKLGLDFPDEVC